MSENQLQAAVIHLCRMYSISWYHTADSRRSNRGWPDLALCGSKGFLLRELKTEIGHITGAQQYWGKRLMAAGQNWSVWRPADLRSGRIQRELSAIR